MPRGYPPAREAAHPPGYASAIDLPEPESTTRPRRTARELARAVGRGRSITEALRHLHANRNEPDARVLAEALAKFLVQRCDDRHAGWRVVRQVVVESAADAPWERCARRAIPHVADDLLHVADDAGRTPLVRGQHVAAQRRAEQLAPHVDPAAVLRELGLPARAVPRELWREALVRAVTARSREQMARAIEAALDGG